MLEQVKVQMGCKPREATAEAGYFSEQSVTDGKSQEINLFVAPDRQKHGEAEPCVPEPVPRGGRDGYDAAETADGGRRGGYKLREAVGEPVFRPIKEQGEFRRFLLRELAKVEAGWKMICVTHNLLKLFRSGLSPQYA